MFAELASIMLNGRRAGSRQSLSPAGFKGFMRVCQEVLWTQHTQKDVFCRSDNLNHQQACQTKKLNRVTLTKKQIRETFKSDCAKIQAWAVLIDTV